MPKVYPPIYKKKAIKLRSSGSTYNEISDELDIAKSTAYIWTKDLKLSNDTKKLLQHKLEKTRNNLKLGKLGKKRHREKIKSKIKHSANSTIRSITFNGGVNKLICAILFWTEGNKNNNSVRFTNSDPKMAAVFVKLLETEFKIDKSKLRALVHIHNYHENKKIKQFWSEITGIPLNQFYKSYKKQNTGKRKRKGYKGCITVYYNDYRIALELKHIYNAYVKSQRGVV